MTLFLIKRSLLGLQTIVKSDLFVLYFLLRLPKSIIQSICFLECYTLNLYN